MERPSPATKRIESCTAISASSPSANDEVQSPNESALAIDPKNQLFSERSPCSPHSSPYTKSMREDPFSRLSKKPALTICNAVYQKLKIQQPQSTRKT
ncbi:MAG TPA: hypothetical protein DCE42_09125 [Myxococcales bacterium]|nr:hypothetical protein [Myxococcales bacterium]